MSVHPQLAGRSCYHRYEIAPGLFTPGTHLDVDPMRCLDEIRVPKDLSGRRALDIGAWDGPFSFELERRGAEVTALDIQDPDITVFNAVKEIRKSRVRYVRGSVYDLSSDELGGFDLVLYAGVYYHLKNPILALQRIRSVLRDGGMLFIEGAASSDHLGYEIARALRLPDSRIPAVTEAIDRLSIAYFDAEHKIYSDWSNWWFPTTRSLEAMLLDSGFRNVKLSLEKNAFSQYTDRRLMGRAEADPAVADPAEQTREHAVLGGEPRSDRLLKDGAAAPSKLRRVAGRARRAVRRRLRR